MFTLPTVDREVLCCIAFVLTGIHHALNFSTWTPQVLCLKVLTHLFMLSFLFFFKVYLSIFREKNAQAGRGAERENLKADSLMSAEPYMWLDTITHIA